METPPIFGGIANAVGRISIVILPSLEIMCEDGDSIARRKGYVC